MLSRVSLALGLGTLAALPEVSFSSSAPAPARQLPDTPVSCLILSHLPLGQVLPPDLAGPGREESLSLYPRAVEQCCFCLKTGFPLASDCFKYPGANSLSFP